MEDNSQPVGIDVPHPSGGCRTAVCEVSGRRILRGKRETLERGAPHGIDGGDPADKIRGMQGPRDSTQDHAAPGYVGHWVVFRPMFRYRSGELIAANTDHPRQ